MPSHGYSFDILSVYCMSRNFFLNLHEKLETRMLHCLLGMPRKLGLWDGFYAPRAEWVIPEVFA